MIRAGGLCAWTGMGVDYGVWGRPMADCLFVRDRAQTSGKAAKEDGMGLFDRFRKPKDTGQVSMDGAVDARSAGAAGPSGTVQVAGAVGAVGAAGNATGEFRLPIADVFTIAGRGVVVGQVAAGACRRGDAAVVVGADGASVVGETTIVGIEAFRKRVDVARQGDMVGLMLRGVSREQVHAGDIVVVRQ